MGTLCPQPRDTVFQAPAVAGEGTPAGCPSVFQSPAKLDARISPRSRLRIDHFGFRQHLVADVPPQPALRVQIHPAAEDRAQLLLLREERKAGDMVGLVLDQDIDVARRAEIVADDGTEEGELADVVPAAELLNRPLRGTYVARYQRVDSVWSARTFLHATRMPDRGPRLQQ